MTVWGYVKMPDGSPAVEASVTVTTAGVTETTTTDSGGKYEVTLTVPSVPVTVTVKAVKGSYEGSATKSGVEGVVQIDVTLKRKPTPKKSTSLTVSVEEREYTVGDEVVVRGSISPAIKVTVTVVVRAPNGTAFRAPVETASDGTFNYTFVVDAPGEWLVYATFAGTGKYKRSTSNMVRLVVKQRSSITLAVRAAGPKRLVVEGSVEPPVPNATVLIYVSLDNGKTWLLYCNATTDESGEFRAELTVTVSGTILVKAAFLGTESVASSETESPPMARLVSEEEQRLRREVKELRRRERELSAKVSGLKSENERLRERVSQLESELQQVSAQLEEVNATLTAMRHQAERYRSEADQYKLVAAAGVPAAFGAGIAAGMSMRRRSAQREAQEESESE